ncbi:single-stranded-DNA-specific exonuclease RecJ [bacterium]|nr:single-stranded-DNA-specific exonuclease RecJ [bacterium]
MSHNWNLPNKIKQDFLDKFSELDPIVVQLLYNRDLKTQEQIDEFLNPDYGEDIHDPFLFTDAKKACQRIYQAIDKQELITIYGDYDADGVSAAVILNSILKVLGAKVETFLPHREKEGYGLNMRAIEELVENKTKLIITCDCGVSNIEEVDLANKNKVDVIITDHHAVPEKLPQAYAIIHPQVDKQYPWKTLAGGGVAFKLAQALLLSPENKLSDQEKETNEKWLLDLVAISTVADMVPLLGENRTLLKYGMTVLKKTKRLGLQKLLEVARLDPGKIDARTIGFSIAPRINAAGRMDHANLAYYLLIETDAKKAENLANNLNQSNLDRQKLTEQTVRQAKIQDVDVKDSLLTFYQEDWPAGLTGLVAGRLSREHNRPCLVMTRVNGLVVGSGRSIKGFDIVQALQKNKKLLEKFGGHPQACGFSFEQKNMDAFVSSMKKIAGQELEGEKFQKSLDIELEINFENISWTIVDLLDKFRPFGQANPEPLFVSNDISVTSARKVGADQKHWKLELVKGNKKLGAIGFGLGKMKLEIGDKIDVVYNLNINEWNGNREIQLNIKDIRSASKLKVESK